MKKVVEKRKDIVFFIKMFPLKMHPKAEEKSKSIMCANTNEKALKLLEDAFDGKELPKAACNSTEIEDNLKLGEKLGIAGTPTIVLPDGGLLPSYMEAEKLIAVIDGSTAPKAEPTTEKN